MPVMFGTSGNSCDSFGVDFDPHSGFTVASTLTKPGINTTQYGVWDAQIWIFTSNYSVYSVTTYGGSGTDSGSIV